MMDRHHSLGFPLPTLVDSVPLEVGKDQDVHDERDGNGQVAGVQGLLTRLPDGKI